jgi:hypothetical protein
LTAVASEDSSAVRFSGYAAPRIGVRDYRHAAEWYQQHLGMTVVEDYREDRCALLTLGDFLPIWLETIEPFVAYQNDAARPYFLTLDIDEAHKYCAQNDLRPSPIVGRADALRVFRFTDLDGNSVYAWTYPQAQASLDEQNAALKTT